MGGSSWRTTGAFLQKSLVSTVPSAIHPVESFTNSHEKWGLLMIRRNICAAALMIGVFLVPAFSHHGTPINYENDKLFTAKATVTAFEYKNPHVRLFFDTTDEHG